MCFLDLSIDYRNNILCFFCNCGFMTIDMDFILRSAYRFLTTVQSLLLKKENIGHPDEKEILSLCHFQLPSYLWHIERELVDVVEGRVLGCLELLPHRPRVSMPPHHVSHDHPSGARPPQALQEQRTLPAGIWGLSSEDDKNHPEHLHPYLLHPCPVPSHVDAIGKAMTFGSPNSYFVENGLVIPKEWNRDYVQREFHSLFFFIITIRSFGFIILCLELLFHEIYIT